MPVFGSHNGRCVQERLHRADWTTCCCFEKFASLVAVHPYTFTDVGDLVLMPQKRFQLRLL